VTLVDAAPAPGQATTMANAGVGLLDISSVYDVDGVDTATPNIAGVSDPGKATFYTRPYRFVRIQKAVEIPGKTVRKINNSAFGPAGMGMREILGYAPIQPDGSVQVQVPANVPFTIDIVDVNAKRVTAQHTSWLQVMPGETKTCNGCHTTVNMTSHGRAGLTNPVNPGAPTTGSPFPNTNPAIALTNAGATMAQTLALSTCTSDGKTPNGATTPCSQILSSDVIYDGIWTVGTTPPQADTAFAYTYALATPTAPTNSSCATWSAQCRSTIHYAVTLAGVATTNLYLQSIWDKATRTNLVNGVMTSTTCSVCHDPVNAMKMVQVPQGQLDLNGTSSNVDPTVVTSYEQLLFAHNAQTLNMGVLQDLLVPAPGPPDPVTGLPTTIMVPVSLAPPMAAGSAAGSTTFFRMFDGSFHDPVLDHTGFMSPSELRLIAEWLDIGAQFFNDPFVAPVAN
jgi:hypothetical protein